MMMIQSISPLPARPPTSSVATHSKHIGIIRPPKDIAIIINKTAEHVAKHGPEFEKVVINDRTILNPDQNFSFLKSSDPYHAYYQNRVAQIRAQPDQPSEEPTPVVDVEVGASKPDSLCQFRPESKVPEAPEPEEFTVRLPQGISEEELDVIKVTAQFAARNGESFLAGLRDRERNNPMFYFLNRNHSLFNFFTSLRDAYSKVLIPPEGLFEKLKKSAGDITTVLERCSNRLEWEHYQKQSKQKAEDEIEQERLRMAAIDWHDHVVVEVIDFDDDEDEYLPPPMTLEEVMRRSKEVTYMEADDNIKAEVVEMDLDEEEMQLVEEGMKVTEVEQPPMRIVKNWKRPEERMTQCDANRDMTISPITGELVPNNEMYEHMRISLIDPRYKEQKERMFAKIRETSLVLAQDDEISRNIVNLARTRPDIFGSTEEEVSSAVKAEFENKERQQVIWDGHAGSIGLVANQAMSQNTREDKNGAKNNEARNLPGPARPSVCPLPPPGVLAVNLPSVPVNTVQYPGINSIGLPVQFPVVGPTMPTMFMPAASIPVPPPPTSGFPTMQMPYMPPPTVVSPPPPLPQARPPTPPHAQPKPKRQKLDDSMLIPEDEFLAQHPGPVSINISIPNVDEGNLRGQLLAITVQSLSETVGSLKEKISEEIQLPSNKQKLSGNPGFLKDNLSLAQYNVGAGQTLFLTVRERGGRKR